MKNVLKRGKSNASLSSLFLLLITIVFFLIGIFFLDPDFGWHIRLGQIMLQTGIPKTDPLSFSMSTYPFVDHEWLTEILVAKLYPIFGMIGLSFIQTILIMFSLFIGVWKSWNKLSLLAVLLSAGTLLSSSGVRPQIVGWFFLSLLIWMLLNNSTQQMWKWSLPLVFLFWANLHGSFAIGLFLLVLYTVFEAIRNKKIKLQDFFIVVLSFVATLANPFGIRLWQQVISISSNPASATPILEWLPTLSRFEFPTIFLLPLSVFTILYYRKKFSFEEMSVYLIFLILALSAQKYVPYFSLATLPIFNKGLNFFVQELQSKEEATTRFIRLYPFLIGAITLSFVLQALYSVTSAFTLREKFAYPIKALEFLIKDPKPKRVFSEYGWGGYIEWKLPNAKLFVDGRMDVWNWQAPNKTESDDVFSEYVNWMAGKTTLQKLSQKYNITTVVLPTRADQSTQRAIKKQTKNAGLEKVYEDSIATVYEK